MMQMGGGEGQAGMPRSYSTSQLSLQYHRSPGMIQFSGGMTLTAPPTAMGQQWMVVGSSSDTQSQPLLHLFT
jgi:hypothetical protein